MNMQIAWKEAYATMQVYGGIPHLTVTNQSPMKKRAKANSQSWFMRLLDLISDDDSSADVQEPWKWK